MLTFQTDYGPVSAGPKVRRYAENLQFEMSQHDKRTTTYKAAKDRMKKLEAAVSMLAEVDWAFDGKLSMTP